MNTALYPANWKDQKFLCLMEANWECAHCGVMYGTLRQSRRTGILFPVLLHAAHVHQDIDNPQPDLIALCPACHLRYDRRCAPRHWVARHRRPGYRVVSVERLAEQLAMAGLDLALDEESGQVTWQCGPLQGQAADPVAAVQQALHFLQSELCDARQAGTAHRPFEERESA